jgi:hypothetical protein
MSMEENEDCEVAKRIWNLFSSECTPPAVSLVSEQCFPTEVTFPLAGFDSRLNGTWVS